MFFFQVHGLPYRKHVSFLESSDIDGLRQLQALSPDDWARLKISVPDEYALFVNTQNPPPQGPNSPYVDVSDRNTVFVRCEVSSKVSSSRVLSHCSILLFTPNLNPLVPVQQQVGAMLLITTPFDFRFSG